MENEKSIKNSKSQRELALLSEKLKKLEEKIKIMKSRERKEKDSSVSNRSMSRNREASNYAKKESSSSRKNLNHYQKPVRNESSKMLKKSYSDKIGIRIPATAKNKKRINENSRSKKSKLEKDDTENNEEEILH